MAKDVSIAFKASDNLTHSIASMRKSVNSLSRDVSEYRKVQSQAFEKRTEVKFDITKAKQELKELEKAVKNNVEGSEKAFKEKAKALEELQEEYKRLGLAAKEASKAELALQKDMQQSKNYQNTMSGQQQSILKTLSGAGLTNMLGGAVSKYGSQLISSTYGDSIGSSVGNIGGGIASGAAIGMIAGPVGAAVGAAVGGLAGAIQSLSEVTAKKDDLYKEEVSSLYNMVKDEQAQGLQEGIDTVSQREKLVMGLGTLLGSKDAGNKLFEDIKQFGIDTPYETIGMVDAAKTMLAYGIEAKDVMSNMKMLGEVAMGDQNKFNSLSYAYAQTQSAGKLTGQDLLQYTSAGFNPLSYLAEEKGKSLQEMRDLMSKGLISADDVTRAFQIATKEGGKFYGAMAQQMETYSGKLAMLDDLQAEVTAGYGEGYNKKRMEGMTKEIEQLGGTIGDKMREANSLIGEYQADLENKYQQSIIDAMTNAMSTDEYMKAKNENNGAEMGRIIAEARAQAEIDYKNSEGYKLQQEADLQLVQNIQEDVAINNGYLEFGFKMAEQFSKGYQNGLAIAAQNGVFTPITSTYKVSGYAKGETYNSNSSGYAPGRYATGIDRVPYNNMPAYLHEGEKVLTKVEADKLRNAQGINIHINNPIIKETADVNTILSHMYSELRKQSFNMGGAY